MGVKNGYNFHIEDSACILMEIIYEKRIFLYILMCS